MRTALTSRSSTPTTTGNRPGSGLAARCESPSAPGADAGSPRAITPRAWEVEAFGEVGGPLQVPAPLIRVRQGTAIVATVRNDLDRPLQVHGLCARDGSPCLPIAVPPGEAREVRFDTGTVGTYYYWATTTGMPLAFRASIDSQLSGALVVDPADGAVDDDRVLVISEWTNLTPEQLQDVVAQADPGAAFLKLKPTVLFTINGRAWPHTERLTYDLGVRVRWRVVNLSSQVHPMHLHGFYFEAERLGDGMRDEAIPADRRPLVVTQLLAPAATMSMSWTPERAGNWLFHCHTMVHVSPTLHVDGSPRSQEGSGHDDHTRSGHDRVGRWASPFADPTIVWNRQPRRRAATRAADVAHGKRAATVRRRRRPWASGWRRIRRRGPCQSQVRRSC